MGFVNEQLFLLILLKYAFDSIYTHHYSSKSFSIFYSADNDNGVHVFALYGHMSM